MHCVYVLKRKDDEYYIGYTNDLIGRVTEHKKEYSCKLIYYEAYIFEKSARNRERKIKYYGSAWRALKKRILA